MSNGIGIKGDKERTPEAQPILSNRKTEKPKVENKTIEYEK